MTAPSGAIPFVPTARLAAIEDRLQIKQGASSDGAGFEALLAEATARQAGSSPFELGGSGALQRRGRPSTALGAASTGQETALAAGSPGARTAIGQSVVNAAMTHLGVPYLWGGTDAEHGFDCSGLVQDAYRQVGIEMPKWSRNQATMGVEVGSIEDALPGDVLTFGEPVTHVALYVGDGRMLHAPKTGEVVKIEAIDRPINSIRRIVTPSGSVPAAAFTGGSPVGPAEHTPGGLERSYQPMFDAAGARWNVDPALLAAVAQTESGFDPQAVSSAGARGLMQFMPATAVEMGVDPWDPASAIDGAARYLRTSLDQFGSVELAIASYNAGRGAVSRYDGIPPYPETQHYVQKVLAAWRSRS